MNFVREVIDYAKEIKNFTRVDWQVYLVWIGLMFGLFGSVLGFILVGYFNGVQFPSYVWNVPIGIFIFVVAISFDTIGHRTRYKEVLKQGEALVHHVTIAAGISSVIVLCLAYAYRDALRIPGYVLTLLCFFYSAIDESMHWKRYMTMHSDRVEMWSHFFIFVGHLIMMAAWLMWFELGYQGVAETLQVLGY